MAIDMGEKNEVGVGVGVESQPSDNPIGEIANICCELSNFWGEVLGNTEKDKSDFFLKIFDGMWEGNDTGEEQEYLLIHWTDEQPKEMQSLALMQASFTSCAYIVQAQKEMVQCKLFQAWHWTSKANYWLGIVIGTWSLRKEQPESINDFAMRGAEARHIENRAMKMDVFKWLDDNRVKFESKNSAARAIAGVIVPVTIETTRTWISQWEKLQSAGRP